jgi:hypothetical protein
LAKVSRHLDLDFAERPNLLSINGDGADESILLEHRHREKRARSRNFHRRDTRGFALRVGRLSFDIGDVNRLLCLKQPSERVLRVRSWRFSAKILDKGRGGIAHRFDAKDLTVKAVHDPEFRLADLGRLFQYDVEHRRKIAGRPVDDPQDFGRGGLLGQHLVALGATGGQPAPEISNKRRIG